MGIVRRYYRAALLALLGGIVTGLIIGFAVAPKRVMTMLNNVYHPGPYPISEASESVHKKLLVVDMHCDAALWSRNILTRSNDGHVDVPRMLEGNVALQGFTAATWLPAGMNSNGTEKRWDLFVPLSFFQRWPADTWNSSFNRAKYQAEIMAEAAAGSDGAFTLIHTREELDAYLKRREENPHITAGFLGIEGMHALEGHIENVGQLYNAGYRMMAPTHFFDNLIGGSGQGMKKYGLTEFGAVVIEEMERLHILLDLAHASHQLILDSCKKSTRPVVVSHTGVKGSCDNGRNLADEALLAIAATDGVIGIGFWETATCGREVADIVRGIRYTADLVGVEHVGLGSDFDGATITPMDASGMGLITEGLIADGFSETDIAKIMGGNTLRVLRATL